MKIWKPSVFGLLVLAAFGCSSADDSDAAKQKCEDLATQFCKSAIACEVSGGLLDESEEASENATCKSKVSQDAECSKAHSVTSSYDACMAKLKNPPCDDVNQAIIDGTLGLPSECEGVILVP
ncbi:MAG TPA: hypothetical protein VFK05_37810 [Polyangiaceae bacterium]|nr:hypothetical protein [Polyangiaceae bacterium]